MSVLSNDYRKIYADGRMIVPVDYATQLVAISPIGRDPFGLNLHGFFTSID